MIKVLQVPMPEMPEPKKGGLVDSVNKGQFIEYLADEETAEDIHDRMIENEVDDMRYELEPTSEPTDEKYDH